MKRRSFLGAAAATVLAPRVFSAPSKPLLSLGLVADAQYADVPAAGTRFYRQSIEKLGTAIELFNKLDLGFCVHLGDLIDRKWDSFDAILKPLAQSKHPVQHLLGNHDFDVLEEQKLDVPGKIGLKKRYGFQDQAGFRFVFLDSTDVSTFSQPKASAQLQAAQALFNKVKNSGLSQAQTWNGAVGKTQLEWLDQTCAEAAKKNLKVILFAHHPVYPDNMHNLWNSADLLKQIDRHRNIVAWFNGHNHAGNFGTRDGVPFVNFKGMVETADTTAFAVANLFEDRLILEGHGREPSRELVFRKS